MRALAVVAVALTLVAAACGSSAERAAPPPTATAAPTPTPEPPPPTPTPVPEPELFDERGPFEVGVITLDLGDRMAEVWYPADVDPTTASTEIFDTLTVFPESLQAFIPAELSGLVDTGAYRDAAPLAGGPDAGFPLVIYSHGFGGYRQVATNYTTHLASWGYVVASTDHLERGIAAQALGTLGGPEDQDIADVLATVEAVDADPIVGPLADVDRVVITGHSAGAGTAARAAAEEVIDGYVSISGGAPDVVTQKPAVVVIGELDAVVPADRSRELFARLEADAVLVNVADGGHNSFTDSCRGIRDLGGLGSLTALIGEDQVGRAEDGCVEPFVQPEVPQAVLNHYTVALLADLFGNPLATDPARSLAVDVTGAMEVPDLDVGASGGPLVPRLVEFEVRA